MALQQSDLVALFNKGLRFVTIEASGRLTQAHADFGSAVKACGTAGGAVAILKADGTYNQRLNSQRGTHDFGVNRYLDGTAGADIASIRQVADRCHFPTDISPSSNALFSSVHMAFSDVTALDIGYALFVSQDETNTNIAATVEMSLVIECPVGSGIHSLITTSTTAAAGTVLTPGMVPLDFTIPKGTRFKIKGGLRATGGGFPFCKFGAGRFNGSAYELFAQQNTTNVLAKPYTDTAALWNARVSDFGTTGNQAQYAIMPTRILAMGTNKAIFIVGDSRSAGGSGDYVNDESLAMGVACRFLAGKVAYINASQNGDKGLLWVSGAHGAKRKAAGLPYCTGTMYAMGTNDTSAAASTQALIDNDAEFKAKVAGTAVNPYYSVTYPPIANDNTNRFYRESDQTVSQFNSARRAHNAYRLSQMGPGLLYDHVFDQASLFEGVDPGKWACAPTARSQAVTTVANSEVITGTFTPADNGLFCLITGAGDSGSDFLFYLEYVDATTCKAKTGSGTYKPVNLGGTFTTIFGYQWSTYGESGLGIHESAQAAPRLKALGLTAAP